MGIHSFLKPYLYVYTTFKCYVKLHPKPKATATLSARQAQSLLLLPVVLDAISHYIHPK
jgi:hypothetical protein